MAHPPARVLPAAAYSRPAPGLSANIRAAGVGVLRHAVCVRLGRARAHRSICGHRAGHIPGVRCRRGHRHGPPGIGGHARGRRHADCRHHHCRLQPGPPAIPQPPRFATAKLHPVAGPDRVVRVQRRRSGSPLARPTLYAGRARGVGVRLRRRICRHQILSVRARRGRLVGVRHLRDRGRHKHRLRRADVLRTRRIRRRAEAQQRDQTIFVGGRAVGLTATTISH